MIQIFRDLTLVPFLVAIALVIVLGLTIYGILYVSKLPGKLINDFGGMKFWLYMIT